MTRLNYGLVIACGMIVIGSFLVELLYLSSMPDFLGGNLYPGMCFPPTCVLSLPIFIVWALSSFRFLNRSPELELNGEKTVSSKEKAFIWAFAYGMIGFYLANLLNLLLCSMSDGYTAIFIVTGGTILGVVIGMLTGQAKNLS